LSSLLHFRSRAQPAHPADVPCPALVLFGNDPADRAQAAWFTADELTAAERASGPLGYVALRVTSKFEQALAQLLPPSHLTADGKADVSLLSPELFPALRTLILADLVRPAPTTPAAPLSSSLGAET